MSSSNPLSKYVLVDTSPARLARLWAQVGAKLEARPSAWRYRHWVLLTTALCLVGLGIGGLQILPALSVKPSAYQGATLETTGDGSKLNLDDGTVLKLGAYSRVEIVAGDQRQITAVRLQRGEIVCDLPPRPNRQFSVYASDVEVRVTGTRFSVRRDDDSDEVEVAVERGAVAVSGPNGLANAKKLSAGERWSRRDQALLQSEDRTASPAAAATALLGQQVPASVNSADGRAAAPLPTMNFAAISPPNSPAHAPPTSPAVATPNSPRPSDGSAAEDNGSDSPKALFDRANLARRAGDNVAAARAYQQLLAKDPNDPRADLAAFELGRLRLSALGDVPGAIRALETAMNHAHSAALREDAMARLVEAYAKSGQPERCRSLRARYLANYPQGVHVALVTRQCGGN